MKNKDGEETCALCGRQTTRYRVVCKGRDGLRPSYYRPRLTREELYLLPEGERPICTNRLVCQRERIVKARWEAAQEQAYAAAERLAAALRSAGFVAQADLRLVVIRFEDYELSAILREA